MMWVTPAKPEPVSLTANWDWTAFRKMAKAVKERQCQMAQVVIWTFVMVSSKSAGTTKLSANPF